MLSKPATMLLGLIYEKPLNAYEIIKLLNYMNVKWWFNIADSTVYSTLKTLEKKEFISGTTFFLSTFTPDEQQELLQERLNILQKYHAGIEKPVFGI